MATVPERVPATVAQERVKWSAVSFVVLLCLPLSLYLVLSRWGPSYPMFLLAFVPLGVFFAAESKRGPLGPGTGRVRRVVVGILTLLLLGLSMTLSTNWTYVLGLLVILDAGARLIADARAWRTATS